MTWTALSLPAPCTHEMHGHACTAAASMACAQQLAYLGSLTATETATQTPKIQLGAGVRRGTSCVLNMAICTAGKITKVRLMVIDEYFGAAMEVRVGGDWGWVSGEDRQLVARLRPDRAEALLATFRLTHDRCCCAYCSHLVAQPASRQLECPPSKART